MKSPELQELLEAAHKLIEANRVRPRKEIPGMALLWVKLAAYEASELHKPAHLHPVSGRSIDDALTPGRVIESVVTEPAPVFLQARQERDGSWLVSAYANGVRGPSINIPPAK